MGKLQFGGPWTTEKLERVRKYLAAYTTIFRGNVRARYFRTTYVDAFAGTGARVDSLPSDAQSRDLLFEVADDADVRSFKKGSTRIALEVRPGFDHYIFVERNVDRASELDALQAEFPTNDIKVCPEEANIFLRSWCATTDWKRNRAVVFLDPYGMQVEWATVEAIAQTQAIDLWWLFPLGVAISRLLTRDEPPPPAFAGALTRMFGTEEWHAAFYETSQEPGLFGPQQTTRKQASFADLSDFIRKRLHGIFAGVASNPLPLRNSKNVPIYLLCFAAGNKKGAPTAVEIAEHILKE